MRSNRTLRMAAVFGVVVATGVTACDNLITEAPPHLLTTDALYTTPAGFEAGVSALYGLAVLFRAGVGMGADRWPQNFHRAHTWTIGTDNGYASFTTCQGDILSNWQSGTSNVGSQNMNSFSSCLHHVYGWLYEIVNGSNTIIERIDDVMWTNEAEKNRLLSEARFFRAWAYRKLTYLWGPVPLSLEEVRSVKTDWVRAPVADVLAQIEQDLLFAVENLPPVTNTSSRVSRATALHFLAENYLRTGQYGEAEQAAEQVIDSGDYSLITSRYGVVANQPGTPYTDMFHDGNVLRNQGNTEALWVFEYEEGVTGGFQHSTRREYGTRYYSIPGVPITYENGGRGQQRGGLTNHAFELYLDEPQDDRFSVHAIRNFYVYSDPEILPLAPEGTQLGDTLWLPLSDNGTDPYRWNTRKFESGTNAQFPTLDASYNDLAHVRLAETYLLAAEAEWRQGKLGEAAEHINAVRRRANVSDIAAVDVTADFILDERSRELMLEEERRYHLLRIGRWYERTQMHNPWGHNIEVKDTVFPFPQPVIDANLDLVMEQNPGW